VFKNNDIKYADTVFYYSLFYLGIVFGMMVIIPFIG